MAGRNKAQGYQKQKQTKKRKKRKLTAREKYERGGRIEAYTGSEALKGKGFPW